MKKKPARILIFFLAGMSIYTMAMSTTMQLTSAAVVNVIKYFKEIAIGSCFLYLFVTAFRNHKLVLLDWLVILLVTYCAAYIFLPIGNFTVFERIVVFKSYGLFAPLYFIGRWLPQGSINSKQLVYGIIALLVLACVVQVFEVITYRHLQSISGYTEYNQKINQLYSSGMYGLTQTFETDLGNKRFASFFQDPLDFAISLVFGICLVVSWIYFGQDEQISKKWQWGILIFLLAGLYHTYSRASMAGSVVALVYFAFITGRKNFFKYVLMVFIGITVYGYFSFDDKVKNYIIDTILFRESSAVSHLLAWLSGIEAIIQQPLGLGLGSSGNYAFSDGQGIGGENQLIFMGVQTGLVSAILYLIIFIYIWVLAALNRNKLHGYDKTLLLALVLFKGASFIPMFTSYFESFLFVSYLTWTLSGYLTSQLVWAKSSASVSTSGT